MQTILSQLLILLIQTLYLIFRQDIYSTSTTYFYIIINLSHTIIFNYIPNHFLYTILYLFVYLATLSHISSSNKLLFSSYSIHCGLFTKLANHFSKCMFISLYTISVSLLLWNTLDTNIFFSFYLFFLILYFFSFEFLFLFLFSDDEEAHDMSHDVTS